MVLERAQRSWKVASSTGWLTARWVKDVVQGLGALHCALCPILSLPGEPCLLILPRAQLDWALGSRLVHRVPPPFPGSPQAPGHPGTPTAFLMRCGVWGRPAALLSPV